VPSNPAEKEIPMSDADYNSRELRIAMNEERTVDVAPLSDRKEARDNFARDLQSDPGLVAERLDWLLLGNYGRGAWLRAWQVMDMGANANKEAALVQLTAIYDWRCPSVMARKAWHTLTTPQKKALSAAVAEVIKRQYIRREKEGI
jgi:hypothetical protein